VSIDVAEVADRLTVVRERIDRAGGGRRVQVVAVTKGFGLDAVEAALELGLDAVGENYAQELLGKAGELEGKAGEPAPTGGVAPTWHFLGRLQRNKVRHLAGVVTVWESVDRAELVDEIARRAPGARVLVQANLSGEPQKGGAPLSDVADLVARGRAAGLAIEGLMGVAPAGPAEAARPGFRELVARADELGLPERSIGMSADLEVAVQEGATMVRVGRGLFGPRPPRPGSTAAPP
jgi:uncharacterized pyridoxal phosphate-containing UPF0001 family protein